MALTITPGGENDDSMLSVAAFKARCDALGRDYSAYDDEDDIEPALRRGSTYVSTAMTWKGCRTNGRDQAQAWPRTDVEDEEGNEVDPDTIPREIEWAVAEAAWYELTVGSLSPNVNLSNRVKSRGIGPLRKEYFAAPMTADAARPVLTALRDMVSGLLANGSNPLVGRVVRG